MPTDGRPGGTPHVAGSPLSVAADDEARGRAVFAMSADGGEVGMALAPDFHSRPFGMVTERFGVGAMVVAGG